MRDAYVKDRCLWKYVAVRLDVLTKSTVPKIENLLQTKRDKKKKTGIAGIGTNRRLICSAISMLITLVITLLFRVNKKVYRLFSVIFVSECNSIGGMCGTVEGAVRL